jgi:hypothetical protein
MHRDVWMLTPRFLLLHLQSSAILCALCVEKGSCSTMNGEDARMPRGAVRPQPRRDSDVARLQRLIQVHRQWSFITTAAAIIYGGPARPRI